jgi:raffinose/stachyose/melibiose transport system substrate-binding protein
MIWRPSLDIAFPKEWNANMYAEKASFTDHGMDMFPFLDLVLANCQPKPLDTDYSTQLMLFGTGKAAMTALGPWAHDNVVETIDAARKDKMGFFPAPVTNDAAKNKLVVAQGWSFVISAKADPKLINAWFDFWVSDPVGKEVFATFNVYISPYGVKTKENSVIADLKQYIDKGEWLFEFQDNNRSPEWFMTDWVAMLDYVAGKFNKEQTLKNMDKSWKDIVSKTK